MKAAGESSFKIITYVYTVINPPPDNSGHMQINSRPWHGGQAQWGAGIIKLVLVFLGVVDLQAGPDG